MDQQPARPPSQSAGFPAYSLHSVERFLLGASEQRNSLLRDIEATSKRITDAEAALAGSSDVELRLSRMVLEVNRVLRGERQANDKAISAIAADAEAEAERILAAAREQVETLRASATRVERAKKHVSAPRPFAYLERRIEERAAALRRIL